jgi:prevent-host-death family protein
MLDMKSVSIRSVQHGLAALIAEVEQGEEIVITRRNQPVARILPVSPALAPDAGTPDAVRAYWQSRPAPPAVRSTFTHADLIAEGRGEV